MTNFVWFFLVEVRALPNEEQPLTAGSLGLLQCFVPAETLETALPTLDDYLQTQAFERVSVRIAQRFEPDISREDVENSILSDGIEEVASTGLPCRGVIVLARESSSWKVPPDETQADQ